MKTRAKPYHLGKTLALGLVAAIAFALLSLFFLFVQARSGDHRIAGKVMSVAESTITIQNAHGKTTVLIVPEDAQLHGVATLDALTLEHHIMSKGSFVDETFIVDRLRVLKDFERK